MNRSFLILLVLIIAFTQVLATPNARRISGNFKQAEKIGEAIAAETKQPPADPPAKLSGDRVAVDDTTTTHEHVADSSDSHYEWRVGTYGDCTATCGEGLRYRPVYCWCSGDSEIVDDQYCSGSKPACEQTCETSVCEAYDWSIGSYGECSVTCGTGVQFRPIYCLGDAGTITQDERLCAGTKPQCERDCELSSCVTYEWSTTSWSDCSVTCSDGTKSRDVYCISTLGMHVEYSYCDGSTPSSDEACSTGVTCSSPSWTNGDWSDCSATCGAGHRDRDVWCALDGSEVSDDQCSGSAPSSSQDCNLATCETFEWLASSYSSCSVTCGTGYEERTVTCMSNLRGVVADSYCSDSKPSDHQSCENDACETFEWDYSSWSSCSATCGDGTKTRSVWCQGDQGSIDDSKCDGVPPDNEAECYEAECETYSWSVGSWSDCPATCGGASETRSLSCVGDQGSIDSTWELCSGTMPALTQDCASDACPVCEWGLTSWSECSVTCGSGVQTRETPCYCDGEVAESSDSCTGSGLSTSQPCELHECVSYEWSIGSYGSCSVTCGTGTQTRTVNCISSAGGVVDWSYCDGSSPSVDRACTADVTECPTPSWTNGEWGDCSASCGEGHRTRDVWCEYNNLEVDSSECSGNGPMGIIACNEGDCEEFSWSSGSWSSCSVTCGDGFETRSVECESSTRGVIADAKCLTYAGDKPSDHRDCETGTDCEEFCWTAGSWSTCSSTCGVGTETRTVTCLGTYGTIDETGDGCTKKSPATKQYCSLSECEVFEWQTGSFGDCSVTCGTGEQTRSVWCQGSYGTIDDDMCTGTMPSETLACVKDGCPSYSWGVTDYSECSASCGEGVKTRTVYCWSSAGGEVADYHCSGTQPSSSETCNLGSCISYEWSISSWGPCSVSCETGTESRTVECYASADGESWPVEATYCDGSCPSRSRDCEATMTTCPTPTWTTGSWSSCSASCGSGHLTRSVTCLYDGETVSDSECSGSSPASTEDCNDGPCETFSWEIGSFGSCSTTCGSGIKQRDINCVSDQRGYVSYSHCEGSAPTDHETCDLGDCEYYDWTTGDWGSCSVTCGDGVYTRTVVCQGSGGTIDESGEECAGIDQPSSQDACSDGACETYSWSITSWSDCSTTCGYGTQTRTVACVGSLGSDVSDDYCEGSAAATSRECVGSTSCESFSWSSGSWGDCSVTCGFGTTTRTVTCIGSWGTVDEDGSKCSGSEPSTSQDCIDAVCEGCAWLPGEWSDCSVTCGDGEKSRDVSCVTTVSGTECDESECAWQSTPDTTGTCELSYCTTYSWYTGHWGSCSVTCGSGTKSRDVYCHDAEGLVVDASYCDGSAPSMDETCTATTSTLCETQPHWANGDWFDCTSSCGAGSRSRLVYCVGTDDSMLSDDECSSATKPASTEDCALCACEEWSWEVGSWGECSTTCGTGYQTREVECRSTVRGYVSTTECSGTEPADTQACTVDAACYEWEAGPWGSCTDGQESRNVYCLGTDGTIDETGSLCTGSVPSETGSC